MDKELRNEEIRKTYKNLVLRHFAKGYIMNFISATYNVSKSHLYNIIREK